MRKELLRILACPDCKEDLELIITKIKPRIIQGKRIEDIWEGALICKRCKRLFPIINGIPWLYPNNLRRRDIEEEFLKKISTKNISKEK